MSGCQRMITFVDGDADQQTVRMAALLRAHHERKAKGFIARDPLTAGRRELAQQRLERKRFMASIFLICLASRGSRPARIQVGAGL